MKNHLLVYFRVREMLQIKRIEGEGNSFTGFFCRIFDALSIFIEILKVLIDVTYELVD